MLGSLLVTYFSLKSQKIKELMKGRFEHISNTTQKHLFYVSSVLN